MDIKMSMPIEFELVETAPLFHELLNLRDAAGYPSIGVEMADGHPLQPLYWVSIRLTSEQSKNTCAIVATACVYGDKANHLAIEDFIVLPEYRHVGLAKIMLERVMTFVDEHASQGTCVSINAHGEEERLCIEYGFEYSHCANLGPNLRKIYA
ncbi:GNAT family N-acetyltransferase [Shewanella xiamenensis]|uniref:GNAT family N-acetyltransferase n=1 Tax=Shewanella xiamenensis TaxID=332186 RepID=A0AAW6QT97_9GAMM|nr:GNAT family N-acetyltransferase [Shewanella xiamenensis]MCL1069981.1 GNAT family N-acetyltransferase [Shewanella xiamenensis]MCR4535168.1 GNAT family N-acetyltransferase [Shewanella xiamenensis]MDG5899244.1 GNAT family N-acetyltransferase [Shewanella xiamenensis]MEE1979743.1 GNAT family N-acetyltransferase [Shewanella xiamenensis]TVL33486.1 GCN5 family acetyltransferase [Shewanella xiamenensis]